MNVVEGHLGQLVLQIPWSNLKNKPVKVLIEDVLLLATPRTDMNYDADEEDQRNQVLKLTKLEDLEISEKISSDSNLTAEEIRKNQSFTDSLVAKIIDNLQITIKNIHVRYEDQTSVPLHSFSLGICLEELSAVSTNAEWDPIFLQDSSNITHKLATLSSLSLYWNTDSDSIKELDPDEIHKFLATVPGQNDSKYDFQYILRPVSGLGRITLNKTAQDGPQTKAQLIFDELGFVFDSDQYRDFLWAIETLRMNQKTKEFKKFRPACVVKDNPKAWFQYAANVVLAEVHQKRREWSWEYILERRSDKLRYIFLYKQKTIAPPLIQSLQDEFDLLERKYSFDDLRFFRSLAKAELKKEKIQPHLQPRKPASNSWSSWIWGASNTSEDVDSFENETDKNLVHITEEQRQELYDAIEWDEKDVITDSIEIPKDTITLEIETTLKTGSFTLRRNPHAHSEDIVQLLFKGFSSSFYGRPDSYLTNLSLHELRVDDGSADTLYKQIVTVKSLSLDESSDDEEVWTRPSENDFFWLSFENNPLDGIADSNLFIKMKGITVFYNTAFLERVIQFFHPPKVHLETIGAILDAANATVEEIRDQTRIGLEYALQEHKTVNLKLDLQAPLIVMPLEISSWASPCAVIDAGHISVTSHLVGKEVIDEVKKKKTLQYTDGDWKKLESLMYDKFNLKLHNTQLLIGSTVRDTMKELHNSTTGGPSKVLDATNLDFLVEISILPDAQSLSKFKISGKLPTFSASMSDTKYKIMMQLFDRCLPNLSFDEYEEKAVQDGSTLLHDNGHTVSNTLPSMVFESDSDNSSFTSEIATSIKSEQKLFEFNFTADEVDLSLYRCLNSVTLEQDPIVGLTLHSFSIYYYFKENEMFADVKIQNLVMEDHTQKDCPDDLTRIASSIQTENDFLDSVFNVKYKRIKSEHLDYNGQPINDQEIEVFMSPMRYVVSPKSFLTILDFVITTFTNPDAPQVVSNFAEDPKAVAKIDVKVKIETITILLNDDGIKLGELLLESSVFNIFLIPEKMKVDARIGKLSLVDEVNEGSPKGSLLRQIISIEGKDLINFKYETFDGTNSDFEYNTAFYLRAGSIRLNVVEEPCLRLLKFMSKFVQMKALYDSAREAAMIQANQIQLRDANRIHLDILISTPIVVFPRLVEFANNGLCDIVVAHLGEIYAKNEYKHFPEDLTGPVANYLDVGVRSIKLISNFNFENEKNQYLEIIDKLDLSFNMSYVEPYDNMTRPATLIDGSLSDISMKLTELQYKFLMDASAVLSSILASESGLEDNELGALEEELKAQKNLQSDLIRIPSVPLNPNNVSKVSAAFHANKISLSLYTNTQNEPPENMDNLTLTKFSLNDSGLKLRMKDTGDIESDFHIKSFTIHDTRTKRENKFTEIIPYANNDEYQFMCNITLFSGDSRKLKTVLTVDSPSMILAMDYLFSLKEFLDFGSVTTTGQFTDENENFEDSDMICESEHTDITSTSSENSIPLYREPVVSSNAEMELEFHINIVDASVILLADPKNENSEAIVFKAEHVILSKEITTVLSANKVGVFLCRMKSFNKNRLRILDDFSLTATIDNRGSSPNSEISKILITCEPLILRLALREVMLALDIVKRASALSAQTNSFTENKKDSETKIYTRFSKVQKLKPSMSKSVQTSVARLQNSRNRSNSTSATKVNIPMIRGQSLVAEFEGMRFVLIGTLNELPMLDMCAKPFTLKIRNWSSDLTIDGGIETFINIYNYEKSAWEPLIEPWDLGLHVSKSSDSKNLSINFFSRRMTEMTVTAQTVSIMNSLSNYLSEDPEEFLKRPRNSVEPYRIYNQTGYNIEVWMDTGDNSSENKRTLIKEGAVIPWKFYDWSTMRENLNSETQKVNLGVKLIESTFDPIRNVSVTSVGEHLHTLYPRTNSVSHRMMCEVFMDESVKCIVLRSALKYENKTKVPIDIAIGNDPNLCWRILPGKSRAIPIEHAYDKAISVRPDPSQGFGWSREPMYWKNLLSGPKSISCLSSTVNNSSKFYLQASALYDKSVPLTRIYPNMTVVLSPPIEITNLLPYDFIYRIFDKTTGRDWSATLERGHSNFLHYVERSHLIMLNVHPKDAGYINSEFAIINNPGKDKSPHQNLITRSLDGQRLNLKLHYV